jgi:PTH1 family peptidyl-tRNA hydrolase
LSGPDLEKPSLFCFVGLGNPGRAYANTRHNLGFMVLDRVAGRWRESFRKGFGPYDAVSALRGGTRVILAKPTTFMNRSGIAVDDAVKRYGVDLSRLVVLSDDFNLPLGRIRIRTKGRDGGHQGLASVILYLGTEEFPRLRLGIGLTPGRDVIKYVLASFPRSERPAAEEMVERAADAVESILDLGVEAAMNRFNG